MRKPVCFVLALLCSVAGMLGCGGSTPSSPTQPTAPTITTMPPMADMLAPKTAAAIRTTTFKLPNGSPVTGVTYVPAVVVNGTLLDSSTADNAPTLANIAKFIQ